MKKQVMSLCGTIAFILSSLGSANAAPFVLDGLVVSYEFNGNANDTSGNGLHGAVYGNATLTSDRLNNNNSAYHFNGSGYIEVPDHTSLRLGNTATISAWILPEDLYRHSIVSKRGSNSPGNLSENYWLTLGSSNQLTMIVGDNSQFDSASASSDNLKLNEWIHVAGVWSETDIQVFVDGELITSNSRNTNSIVQSNFPLRIGYDSRASWYFEGKIDDVFIYDRALSESEIQQLSAVPIPGAVWLLGSGLAGLVGLRRKNNNNNKQDRGILSPPCQN